MNLTKPEEPYNVIMNLNKQRIAIAEYCGWRRVDDDSEMYPYWLAPKGDWRYGHPLDANIFKGSMLVKMFPYLDDLNAMHGVESILFEQNSANEEIYHRHLRRMLGHNGVFRATAAQRAEAFLKTIDKWKK